VAAALAALGETRLGIHLGMQIAGRGSNCWETDAQVADEIERTTGWRPHRESIGRKRRQMASRGLIQSTRIFMGTKPKGAKFATSHGTTEKRVLWSALGLRDPRGRAERRKARDEQPQPRRLAPRYAAFPPAPPSRIAPELAELAELAMAAMGASAMRVPEPSTERASVGVRPEGADPPE
jgi:hypothetical protein